MDNLFETVVVGVALVGIAASFTRLLWPFRAADQIGQVGGAWFDHEEDRGLEDCRDCNQNDPPIPRRRLRARM